MGPIVFSDVCAVRFITLGTPPGLFKAQISARMIAVPQTIAVIIMELSATFSTALGWTVFFDGSFNIPGYTAGGPWDRFVEEHA